MGHPSPIRTGGTIALVLLVIFGAGASYDSVYHMPPSSPRAAVLPVPLGVEQYRPPLANQLFDTRDTFVQAMRTFNRFMPLINLLRRPDVEVEQELAKFQEQANKFPERDKQLMAIRYYLQRALWECQAEWYKVHNGITNFVTLLDEIERWRFETNEQVCLVTFNYDTILEQSMPRTAGIVLDEISKYVRHGTYLLVKLHGSTEWAQYVEEYSSQIRSCDDIIEHAGRLRASCQYVKTNSAGLARYNDIPILPAIAIPVQKKDQFVCPDDHITALSQALPQVTKIITIGWRATEDRFLELLRSHAKSVSRVMVVSGDEKGATETAQNLGPHIGMPAGPLKITTGFTGLINRIDQLDAFLRH